MSKIVLYPDQVLTNPPAPVTLFDDALRELVKEMFRVLYATETGVGLAAVQVGIPLNLFVVDTAATNKSKKAEHREGRAFVACNAELISAEEFDLSNEGCLSFPEVYMNVPRARRVKVKAQDMDGNWFEIEADDFEARVVQHEMDHCAGKICFDRAYRRDRRLLPLMIKDAKKKGLWKPPA